VDPNAKLSKRVIRELALLDAAAGVENGADMWDPPLEIDNLPSKARDDADERWRARLRYLAHRLRVAGVR